MSGVQAPPSHADLAPSLPTLSRSLWGCLIGNFFLRAASAASGQLIALMLASMARSGDPVATGTLQSLVFVTFFVPELLAAPVFGAMADRYGQRIFMMLGPIFGGVAIQMLAFTNLVPVILLVRVLEGLSTASSTPSTLGYLSQDTVHSTALRGRVMSLYEVATVVGFALGFVLAGPLWDTFQQHAFSLVTVIYAISLLAFFAVRRHRQRLRTEHRTLLGYLGLLGQPKILRFIPAWLAVNGVLGIWFSQGTFQLSGKPDPDQLLMGGYSGTQISMAFALFGFVFTLGAYLWGNAFGRLSKSAIMRIGLGGTFLFVTALFAINHSTPELLPLIVALAAVALGGVLLQSGFTPAALAYLADIAEEVPEHRGTVMGLYSVALAVGQFLGGGMAGFFADFRGIDGLLLLTTILGTIALASVEVMRRGERRASP